jgi:3-deoxy-D-manno-octulosonic acid (KDO) 8-phosphate synthase
MDILRNKKFFKDIIAAHPKANRCIELSPRAFLNPTDEKKIVKKLAETRVFLESL